MSLGQKENAYLFLCLSDPESIVLTVIKHVIVSVGTASGK